MIEGTVDNAVCGVGGRSSWCWEEGDRDIFRSTTGPFSMIEDKSIGADGPRAGNWRVGGGSSVLRSNHDCQWKHFVVEQVILTCKHTIRT